MNYIYNVRFDDNSGFNVVHRDAVGAICAAVKLHNALGIAADNGGEGSSGLKRLSSRNVLSAERLITDVDANAAGGAA